MSFQPTLQIIPEEYYEQIHESTVKLLSEHGLRFPLEEALDILKANGAEVNGDIVRFPRTLINDLMKTFKPTFTWKARDPKYTLEVGDGNVRVYPHTGAVFMIDYDGTRRRGTMADYSNIQRLMQATDAVDIVGAQPISPNDVDINTKNIDMMYETLKLTTKPFVSLPGPRDIVTKTLDMAEAVIGKEEFRNNVYTICGAPSKSPLDWSGEVLSTIIDYIKRGQGLTITPCLMAGLTGPISLMESVVLYNTEVISGCLFAKMINPNAPVFYVGASGVGNMKNGLFYSGSPEFMMVTMAGLQMAKHFYHLPSICMSGMTDSKVCDTQAGYETMQNLMMGILCETDVFNQATGTLDTILAFNYEKYILDIEMIDRVRLIRNGLKPFDASFSTDLIEEVGIAGDFFSHTNTFENFRRRWNADISCATAYGPWEANGCRRIEEIAHEKWQAILAETPDCLLSEEQLKALNDYMSTIR